MLAKILITGLLFNVLIADTKEEDLRDNKAYAIDDKRAYSFYDRRHNLDVIKKINKHISTKWLDNNIWVYTKEFAKRFELPKRWIGKSDFKGALALAYRQEIYKARTCGFFQSWDGCQEFSTVHVVDVYLPHDSKTVPWNTKKMYGQKAGGGEYSSRHWLRPFHFKAGKETIYRSTYELKDKKNILTKESYNDLLSYRGIEENNRGVGIDSISGAHSFKSSGFGSSTSVENVRSFYRNVYEGIDFLSIKSSSTFASSGSPDMQIWLYNMTNHDKKTKEYFKKFPKAHKNGRMRKPVHKDRYAEHKIYPGADFMKRVKDYDDSNSNTSFFEFFKRNINKKDK